VSAIYGIVGPASATELAAMGERLHHRGPVERIWQPAPDVNFGWRGRAGLSSLDQIVFTGMLDNVAELGALLGLSIAMLSAIKHRDLVWEIFQRFGLDGFARLDGQFACAIWNPREGRLAFACDRWGAESIYYTHTRGRLAFASEYKALLALADVPARWNPDAVLWGVRTHNANPRLTFLADVQVVPRGSWVEIGGSTAPTSRRFTTIDVNLVNRSEQQHGEAIRNALFDALRRQTEHLDRIGLALSGGLDSALVLSGIKHVAPTKPVHTFTVGHGDEDREIIGARETAQHFKTDHHEIIVGPEQLPAVLPEAIWHMEDPVGGEEMIYSFIAAREAARYVDTIFAGEKSDALFAGMPRHLMMKLATYTGPFRDMVEEFYHYTQSRRMPKSFSGRKLVDFYYRQDKPWAINVLGSEELPPARPLPFASRQPITDKLAGDILDGSSTLGATVQLNAAHGLAWNSPFMDAAMVRTAFEIPDRLKIRGMRQKYILRKACEGLAPESVLRRKKSLQRLRTDMRLTDTLESLAAELLSPDAVRNRGMFDATQVQEIRRRRGAAPYSREQVFSIWSLLITEIWARLYIDRRGERPTTRTAP
jgi:asparagine synthase (glutamine-hydrolysing)